MCKVEDLLEALREIEDYEDVQSDEDNHVLDEIVHIAKSAIAKATEALEPTPREPEVGDRLTNDNSTSWLIDEVIGKLGQSYRLKITNGTTDQYVWYHTENSSWRIFEG